MFNADPYPAFYLKKNADADPDPDQGAKPMRIHTDLNHGQTLKSQIVEFLLLKYILKLVIGLKNIPTKVKAFLKGRKSGLFC